MGWSVGLSGTTVALTELAGIYGGVIQYNNPEYDSVAMLDFVYSLERRQFSFYRPDTSDSRFYARIFAQVDLIDSRGFVVDSSSTLYTAGAESLEEADKPGLRLFDRLQLFARPGIYAARISIIDAISKRKGEVFIDRIVVAPSAKKRLHFGGACMAYRVKYIGSATGPANPRLIRNGYEIIPNPISVYSVEDSTMAIYTELYNIKTAIGDESKPLQVFYSIVTSAGEVARPLGMRRVGRPGKSAVLADNLDIKGLETGDYRVRMIVSDPISNEVDTSLTAFRILVPRTTQLASESTSRTDPYDSLPFIDKIRLVSYLLDPDEQRVFSSLNDTGKVNFLVQYWREHDPTPNSPWNETRREMIRRLSFVNELFSNNPKNDNGWSTDRGRIYMTFGPWEERDQNPAPMAGNPYDIWHYRTLKEGKVFVFEDVNNADDYRLVHSNVEGERFDEGWNDRINYEGLDIY